MSNISSKTVCSDVLSKYFSSYASGSHTSHFTLGPHCETRARHLITLGSPSSQWRETSSSRRRRDCRWRFLFSTRNFTASRLIRVPGWAWAESGSEKSPPSFKKPEIIILWFNALTCRHLQNKHTLWLKLQLFPTSLLLHFPGLFPVLQYTSSTTVSLNYYNS